MARRKRLKTPGANSERIKRLIAARMAQQFRDRPELGQKLIDAGLMTREGLDRIDKDFDLGSFVVGLRDQIAERARTEPSFLGSLNLRPLELLAPERSEAETSRSLRQTSLVVVFSDLEGFTTWTSENGDLEAGALLTDHYAAVETVVRSRGGRVVKTIGDGHMLAFTEPVAAVLASAELPRAETGPLRLRVGGHVGDVVDTGDDLLGHVVNVAARIADLAPGGSALATVALRNAATPVTGIRFGDPRLERLAGIEEPIHVCEVGVLS